MDAITLGTPSAPDLLPGKRPPRDRLLLPGRLGRERRAVQHLEPASNFTAHAHVQVRLGGLDVALEVSGDLGPVSRLGGGAAASSGFWWRPSGLGVSRDGPRGDFSPCAEKKS